MKRFFIFALLLFALLIASALPVFALENDGAGNAIETKGDNGYIETDGDYYFFYSSLDLQAANKINGKIGGDLIAASINLEVNAEIGGNIRAAATYLSFINTTAKNATVAATNLYFDENSVFKAIYAIGGVVEFKGVCDCFSVTGGDVYINGTVENETYVNATNVYIDLKSKTGKIKIESPNKPVLVSQGVELGAYDDIKNDFDIEYIKTESAQALKIINLKSKIPTGVFLSVMLCLLFSVPMENFKHELENNKGRVIGFGALGLLLIPILCFIFLLISYLWIAGTVLFLIYCAVCFTAKSIFAVYIARAFLPKINKYLAVLVTSTLITLTGLVPYLSFAVSLCSLIVAFGFILTRVFKIKKEIPLLQTENFDV